MTESEKALKGEIFDTRDKELFTMKQKTHKLCMEYNTLDEFNPRRNEIIKEMFNKVGEKVYFRGPINVTIGKHTTIGNNFFANFNFTLLDSGKVEIGDDVLIAPNVSILAANHPLDFYDRMQYKFSDGHEGVSEFSKPIKIGNGVWIAANVVICEGVTIGDHAVIGVNSVVMNDIPEGYIAYGCPAKPIRKVSR